jgi:hypothetical protein
VDIPKHPKMETESPIKTHNFQGKVAEEEIFFQVTNLGPSLYIWIGTRAAEMADLTLSSPTPYDSSKGLPTTTKIIGTSMDNTTEALAAKLSKRLGKAVLLSLNVKIPTNSLLFSDLEKILFEEIKSSPLHFL